MLRIAHSRPEERASALDLLFRHLAEPERQGRVANALRLLDAGHLDPEGIFTVHDEAGLCGVLAATPLAGAGSLIWPPQTVTVAPAHRPDAENRLVEAAKEWLVRRGAKLAQALLAPEENALAGPLLRNGFRRLTRLEYLRRGLTDFPQPPAPSARFTFQPYHTEVQGIFQQTLLRSYEGSLDCPELNEARSIDEIIAGHKAQGEFDAGRWWLAWQHTGPQVRRRPAGVLLSTKVSDEPCWDLSYVGIVPEARRQGLGRALTQLALSQAKDAGASQLTVAVDLRNIPARNLYADLGFVAASQRDVYLAFLGLK